MFLSLCIFCNVSQVMEYEKGHESSAVGKGEGDSHVNDGAAKEHRITLLETELQQQEHLILGYQRENIKLCQEMKLLKVRLKYALLFLRLIVWCHLIRASVKCLVIDLIAAQVSCPTGSISWAGSTKP